MHLRRIPTIAAVDFPLLSFPAFSDYPLPFAVCRLPFCLFRCFLCNAPIFVFLRRRNSAPCSAVTSPYSVRK